METSKPSTTNCPFAFFLVSDIYCQPRYSNVTTLYDNILFAASIVMIRFKEIQVAIAQGFHLFPFRTEKLSLVTPMVLRLWESR